MFNLVREDAYSNGYSYSDELKLKVNDILNGSIKAYHLSKNAQMYAFWDKNEKTLGK